MNHSDPIRPDSRAPIGLIVLILLGLLIRILLAFISWGSNDATTWQLFGKNILDHGILWLYHNNRDFNHPPLPGYFAAGVYWVTHLGANPPDLNARYMGFSFPFVFKMFDVAADALTCRLLWKILLPRRGAIFAAGAACLFAWSPDSILLTGHHCNTDPIYVMLCLLCVYLVEDRGRDFLGGLALAAAINVKLIPVLLILPFAGTYHDRRRAARFLFGVFPGIIPFIPVLLLEGRKFYYHAIAYGSTAGKWGIDYFLLESLGDPRLHRMVNIIGSEYFVKGRFIIIAAVLLMTIRARRTRRFNCYTLAAAALALFLILTPGFGIQYTLLVLPLLYATGRMLAATIYSLLTGAFLFFSYFANWKGGLPIDTWSNFGVGSSGPLYGLLAWATLIVFVYDELRHPRQTDLNAR